MSRPYRIGDYSRVPAKLQADEYLGRECRACGHYRDLHAHVLEDPCTGPGHSLEDTCGCAVDSYILEAVAEVLESRPFQRPQPNCGCMCHSVPGVRHVAACCDAPPIDF